MDDMENVSLPSSTNQLNNNPFSELSNESFHKLDEVLNSDSVKQLLSDSKNLDKLTASVLEAQASTSTSLMSSNVNSNVLINSSTTIAPGHVATVQEGLDLVDALDSLVNQLTASQPSSHQHQTQHQQQHQHQPQPQLQPQPQPQPQPQLQPQIQHQHYNQSQSHQIHLQYHISHPTEIETLGGNLEVGSSVDFFIDSIFLDHNYACVPVKQKFAVKIKNLNSNQEAEANNQDINITNISASCNFNSSNNNNDKNRNAPFKTTSFQSSPSPARRSQRQIERIEKSVLEKIKAENQEMLKREREEMEAQKIGKDLEAKRKSLDTGFDSSTQGKEEDGVDEDKSRGLIIDFDMNKKKIGKKRGRKKLRTNSEGSSPLKHKVDDTRRELKENLDKSIEEDKVDAKNLSSQRSQRQRRKPKRWEDDEVEVDFSQKLLELDSENNSQSNSKPRSIKKDEKEKSAKEPKSSDDEDNEEDESEEYASDDDPDKLWCICRQPHNNRFMISCDGCEDWFHGKCVGVTRAMGRVYEKEGKKWYCLKCKDSKEPPNVVNKIESKSETLEPKSLENVTPIKKLTKPKLEEKKESVKKLKSENKPKLGSVLKAKVKGKSFRGQMSAEKKEAYRLKKLIKSTKLELKKTLNENKKESPKDTTSSTAEADKGLNRWEPISRVVPLIRKSEEKKKKLKHLPIDPSFNDLFKAEPLVMSKKAPSTPLTSPSTSSLSSSSNQPSTLKRSSSVTNESSHTSKKMATSGASQESSCVACGKALTKVTIRGKETSIYCAENCIEKHLKDMVESIKSTRNSSSSTSLVSKAERILKINLVDKVTGRLMSGSNAITEDKVLDYLKSNPTFEILKPNVIKKHSSSSNQQSEHEKKKDGSKSSLHHSKLLANKKKEEVTKQKSIESVIKPSSKSEEPTSETIRLSVKKALKEALWTRCQETDNKMLTDDIKKIAFKIEEELFNYFNKETSSKYKNRYRSLVFNLRDPKNQGLFRKVVSGSISPERLVKMSPEELASSELAKWRERETKHAIEMIKRDAEQMSQQVIVKKTHKGEELIETLTSLETINTAKGEELANKSGSSDSQVLITSSSVLSSPSKEKINTSATLLTSDSDAVREGKSGTMVDERRKEEDSTDKHGQHLYDLHCKICTKQTKQDLSLTHFKTKTVGSSPTCSTFTSSHETKVSQPKRVRVEFDEPTNKIIEEAAKLSRSAKEAKLNESNLGEPSKDTSLLSSSFIPSPDDSSNSTSKVKSIACWKGFIYMQDVAKFVASAYKVSGIIETQIKDIPDTVTVCGRIAPEQVLDYLKKLKYSTRTEISIIRFAPTNHEEKIGYDAFFSYLNHRKRYGVVGGTGKTIKDFYILPLPKENDAPDVLLPFDGPGLDKLSNRNNLLLGILVKNKKYQLKSTIKEKQPSVDTNKSSTENANSSREQPERSYTPPLPLSSKNDSVSEDAYDPGLNLQPLGDESQVSSISKDLDESEEPYDPEENDLNTPESCSQSSIKVSDLLDQLSKTNNPVEMTSTFLGSVAKNATIEEQKRLLEELTKRVEDSKRQLEEQRKAAEAAFTIASKSIDIINKTESSIPGLDGSYPSNDPNRSTLLDSLQIPENLKEILETVKQRGTFETDQKDEKIKSLSFDDPIVRHFGQENLDEDEDMKKDELKSSLPGIESLEDEEKKIPEPMEIEEEDDEGVDKRGTIIEVNNTKARIDPRLRSKKQQPLFLSTLASSGTDKSVSQLKDDELIMKAHLQFEALKRMEMQQLRLEEAQKQAYKALSSMSDLNEAATSSSPSSSTPSSIILSQSAPTIFSSSSPSQQQQPPPKLKIEWKKTCKPITKS